MKDVRCFRCLRCFDRCREQNGAALIIALSMLAILSLLGTIVLNSTHAELSIASNYRAGQQAFYAAERAVEYSMTSETIYSTIGEGSVDLVDDHAAVIAADTTNSGLKEGELCRVSYLASGSLPPGSGFDPTRFQARYYIVSATSEGALGATARVEAQVARVVPR